MGGIRTPVIGGRVKIAGQDLSARLWSPIGVQSENIDKNAAV